MRKILKYLLLLVIWAGRRERSFSQSPEKADTLSDAGGLIAGREGPRLISGQFAFTEGASVDKRGNVYFTDQPNNRIWRYSVDGELSVFMDGAGRSNGMYFDRKGNLVTCADEKDELWSIGRQGRVKVLLHDYQGHLFNGPNDCWIDPHGGIYFTDPYYQRAYWTRTQPDLDRQCVYYLPRHGREAIVLDSTLRQPNGIVGTPDGRQLYVSDLQDGKTWRYRIRPDGRLTDRTLFVGQGSDGMTLDERGNVYLTGNGVTVYDSSGNKIAHIPIPEKWTGNLCYGGRDRRRLFITASHGLYVIDMKVRGVE